MSRPPTPRHLGPYSPRHPSPLGFPPLAPHVAFQQPTYAWPHTPDRVVQPKGPSNRKVAFPPEARRPPLAGSTQRPKSQPPPPLKLDDRHHRSPLPAPPKTGNALTVPGGREIEPSSPALTITPSEASSLSLYSPDNVAKNFPVEVVQKQEEDRPKNPFCSCFGLFSRRSKDKEKEARILGPPVPKIVQPAPVPQMTQTGRMISGGRRRPSPLNL
jgi:hypothetical protein